jgi:ketosteroid isomerase-like protein
MERSAEVEVIVATLYEALRTGEMEAFEAHVSDSVLAIGTDPDEWWEGKAATMRAFREQAEAMGGSFPIEPGETSAYAIGDVAWFAGRPAFVVGDDRVPCRHTGVFARENGDWKLVETHISIGVPNEEAVGQELPT